MIDYMLFVGIAVGVFATLVIMKFLSWNSDRIDRKKEKRLAIIKMEKAGWIKVKDFPDGWHNKSYVKNWMKDNKDTIEMYEWIMENIEGDFERSYAHGSSYLKFKSDEDAVKFKLRWL